jgi:short-subunit dehydrogenase
MKLNSAIIIGATSGIGKGVAKILLENNYKIGITGRRTELLKEIKIDNPLIYIKTIDITETNSAINQLEELANEMGAIDLLIICSSFGEINEKLNFEIEKQTIETNVVGFTCIANWAVHFFEIQKYGHLAAISSIAGIRGNRHAPAYYASKAFQINYLESIRQKAKSLKNPFYVTDIRPGFVDTNMAKGDGLFWVSSVNKASKQIFNAIRNKRKVVYISRRWLLISVILKILPRFIYDRM